MSLCKYVLAWCLVSSSYTDAVFTYIYFPCYLFEISLSCCIYFKYIKSFYDFKLYLQRLKDFYWEEESLSYGCCFFIPFPSFPPAVQGRGQSESKVSGGQRCVVKGGGISPSYLPPPRTELGARDYLMMDSIIPFYLLEKCHCITLGRSWTQVYLYRSSVKLKFIQNKKFLKFG